MQRWRPASHCWRWPWGARRSFASTPRRIAPHTEHVHVPCASAGHVTIRFVLSFSQSVLLGQNNPTDNCFVTHTQSSRCLEPPSLDSSHYQLPGLPDPRHRRSRQLPTFLPPSIPHCDHSLPLVQGPRSSQPATTQCRPAHSHAAPLAYSRDRHPRGLRLPMQNPLSRSRNRRKPLTAPRYLCSRLLSRRQLGRLPRPDRDPCPRARGCPRRICLQWHLQLDNIFA